MPIKTKTGEDVKMPRVSAFELCFRQKLKLLLKYIELQGNNQYSTAAKQQRKRPMPIKTKTGEDVKMPRVSAFELCFRQKLKLLLKYIELQGNNQYSTAAKQQRKRPMPIKTKTGEDVKMPRVSAFELCFRQKLKLLLKCIELQGNNQYSTAAKQQRKRPMQIKTKTGEDVKMPRVSAFEL